MFKLVVQFLLELESVQSKDVGFSEKGQNRVRLLGKRAKTVIWRHINYVERHNGNK